MANRLLKRDRAAARRKTFALVSPVVVAVQAVADRDATRARAHEQNINLPRRAEQTPMIERYHARGSLDRVQKQAADRLLDDWSASGLAPRVVADYGQGVGGGGGGGPPIGPGAVRYMQAMRAVGAILSPALCAVVIDNWSAEAWAGRQGRPAKDGIAALRLGLDALAVHYGMRAAPPAYKGLDLAAALT